MGILTYSIWGSTGETAIIPEGIAMLYQSVN